MASVYQEQQRNKAIALIKAKSIFEDAVGGKYYRGDHREFILLDNLKNLYPSIREVAIKYFRENDISWWGGKNPTGHVLSSQIACLNHLFFIRNDFNSVRTLLKTINSDLEEPLLIQTDKDPAGYIQFEAVSDKDHLNEIYTTRGNNCTSIDALIYAKHRNGEKWLIPIEWKYTEFYGNLNKAEEVIQKDGRSIDKGKERQTRYNDLILNSSQLAVKNLKYYYFEPFYQLMRQTLWAEQMIRFKTQETLKADDYMHIHVIPDSNGDLLKKIYKCSGLDMEGTWRSLLKDQSKYKILTPQYLMSGLLSIPKYDDLVNYLKIRYW